eukprot:1136375-Rhodomonas_salina.1
MRRFGSRSKTPVFVFGSTMQYLRPRAQGPGMHAMEFNLGRFPVNVACFWSRSEGRFAEIPVLDVV